MCYSNLLSESSSYTLVSLSSFILNGRNTIQHFVILCFCVKLKYQSVIQKVMLPTVMCVVGFLKRESRLQISLCYCTL